jgi:hypothetical protein
LRRILTVKFMKEILEEQKAFQNDRFEIISSPLYRKEE